MPCTRYSTRAVAVIGTSDDVIRHDHMVLTNLRNTGFTGGINRTSRRLTATDLNPVIPGESGPVAADAPPESIA